MRSGNADVYDREDIQHRSQAPSRRRSRCDNCRFRGWGRARKGFTRALAVRWDRTIFPLVGLDLLLSFVSEADDGQYDDIIIKTFHAIRNFNDGSSATAFCEFIKEHILPDFAGTSDQPENDLFRLLALFLTGRQRFLLKQRQ